MSAAALAGAAPRVLWLDDPDAPAPLPPASGRVRADLVVVGGGYTGLWTALRAVEREPGRSVVVLEAGRCGHEASGRNGGFASASLTHGFGNGLERWPDELAVLDRLGAENLDAIGETVERYGIDCGWERTGELSVATAPHQVEELADVAGLMREHGHDVDVLDGDAVRTLVDSPTYLGGLRDAGGTALVEPARLAWGLRRACLDAGVRIFEGSRVTAVEREGAGPGAGVVVRTASSGSSTGAASGGAVVRARHAVLATNGFTPLLRRLRLMTVPVYDHVLATEPLSAAQRKAIGWEGREGVGDAANLFHYYRLTRDDRILWGGYDAVYHYGSKVARSLEQNERTHRLLAEHFFATFPQLEGLGFSHRWGGVIDTCTRFCAFFGTAHAGHTAYALGFTGLGVAATRFAADVALDLLQQEATGEETERTALRMVRETPLPFPPEPFRSVGINLTRWSLARSDAAGGRRNAWLRALDAAGLGFDS